MPGTKSAMTLSEATEKIEEYMCLWGIEEISILHKPYVFDKA
jgi:hypothetical protein